MALPDLNSPEAQAAEQERQRQAAAQKAADSAAASASTGVSSPVADFTGGVATGIGGAIDDMFSAETVSGPSGGQWGASGTAAAGQNAALAAKGDAIAAGTNQTAGGLLAQATGASNRDAPQTSYGAADKYGSLGDSARTTAAGYLGEAGSSAQQEQQLGALNAFANQGPGPSAAQAQLAAAGDNAQLSALSMARSGRGAGDSASALRDATFSNATTQATTGQNMAQLRAQEEAAFRGQQLQALEAAMGGAGAIRGADATATQLAQGVRSQDLASQAQAASQAQFDTSAGLQQTGLNDSLQLGLIGQAQGFQGMGIDAGLGYAGLGQQALDSQSQYELEQQQMKLDAAKANQSADLEKDSGVTGMAASALGAVFSDERVKELEQRESALADALETVGNAPGYSYRYKDPDQPGAKPGRMVGPMAQDIERGPLGDSVVMDTPRGKMVDPGRLEMVNTSAITELNNKVKALEAALGRSAA